MVNEALDRMMYDRGVLDRYLPFARLKESRWINEVADRAPSHGFGEYLRQEIVGYRRETGEGSGLSEQLEGEKP